MAMASPASRITNAPGFSNPGIGGTVLELPMASTRRSKDSVSPVPRNTRFEGRSMRVATVLSQAVMSWSSYHSSPSRYRPCMAERPKTRREMPMRL